MRLTNRLRKRVRTAMKKPARTRRKRGRQSGREIEFLQVWKSMAGPHLDSQVQFHPLRRWRFDWAHPASKVAIEIHGGIWIHGRHVTGAGFWGDRIKMNAALRLGWKVFELTSGDLVDNRVYREILDEIRLRLEEPAPDREGVSAFADVYPKTKQRSKS